MSYIDNLLDYLIWESGCDTCGRCINYIPFTEEEELRLGDMLRSCKAAKSRSDVPTVETCREGMKEYFKRKVNDD